MEIVEVSANGLKREFKVKIEADYIAKRMEERLGEIGRRTKIPGFRPGKIPMDVLRQRYGKSVESEVLKAALDHGARATFDKKPYRPALPPQVNITSYKPETGLEYTLSVEILPEVPEIAFDGIVLDRLVYEVPAAEVDTAVERLLKSRKKFSKVEGRKAKTGDLLIMDFKGKVDGKLFEGGTAENFRIELGSGFLIPGFEEQLEGASAGKDVTVNVTFPENYHNRELAGKEAEFAVTVKEIQEAQLPELNDEFAKSVGFDSVQALREKVTEHVDKEYQAFVRARLKKALFDILEEKYPFEVPAGMLELEFNAIWDQLQKAKSKGDPSVQKSDDELKAEYKKISERRVRLGILLSELGRKNNVLVTQDELRKEIINQAVMFPGQERKVIEFYEKNPKNVDDLRGPLFEDKVVNFILEKVKFNDTKVTLDELRKLSEEESGEAPAPAKSAAKKKTAAAKEEKGAAPKKPAKAKGKATQAE